MPLTVGATIEPDGSGINDRTSTEARWWFMKELSSSDSCAEIQRIEKELQVLQELLSEKNREYREVKYTTKSTHERMLTVPNADAIRLSKTGKSRTHHRHHYRGGEEKPFLRALQESDEFTSRYPRLIGPCPTCFRSMYDCPRSDSALLEIVKILGGDGEPYDPKLWKGWWIEDEE
ncbi:hypothetical protein VNI00_015947 [Paramarasmius palmivorus]|uniref:Uncharacterized protein n=1 Tax=Paramarasmius palmivorus TaxID=297713 RepID=A0AAW0BH74_9AGAR